MKNALPELERLLHLLVRPLLGHWRGRLHVRIGLARLLFGSLAFFVALGAPHLPARARQSAPLRRAHDNFAATTKTTSARDTVLACGFAISLRSCTIVGRLCTGMQRHSRVHNWEKDD